MGSQQLLLIILGVIIVAIAIAFGIYVFDTMAVSSNKDGLLNDVNDVSSDAFAYYQRAQIMGGGNGSFTGYRMNSAYVSNEHGDISVTIQGGGRSIDIVATSRNGYGTITATINDRGQLSTPVFTGEFQ